MIMVNTELDVVDADDGLTSLREAVVSANTTPGDDEIGFDFGHDGPATIRLEEGELKITDPLTITGDGPYLLTIDAQEESRVFHITANTGNFVLTGMTLTGGKTTNGSFNGGAVCSLTSGMLTMESLAVRGNLATGHTGTGGGIFATGSVTIISSTVSGNVDDGGASVVAGGDVMVTSSAIGDNSDCGIRAYGNATIIDSTISGNGRGGVGGNTVNVSSSTIAGNLEHGVGGDIVHISNSTISGNLGHGVRGDTVNVTESTISGNLGHGVRGETVHVSYSTVSANADHAIAFFHGRGHFTVTSSTISGNFATGVRGEIVNVSYSTVVGNGADGAGGGIDAQTLTIKNSIVAGHTAGGTAADVLSAESAVIAHSLIGHNNGCSLPEAPLGLPDANGNLIGGPMYGTIDPMLAPLADNGGLTFTHALLSGSPAIDAGDPKAEAGVGDTPLYDQRSASYRRVRGGRIDLGAHERQPLTVEIYGVASPTVTPTDEITIGFSQAVNGFDLDDLKLSLNEGENLLTTDQTLSTSDSQTFVLGRLDEVTTGSGYYTLELIAGGSGIRDGSGGPLDCGDDVSWAMGRSVLGLTVDTLMDERDGSIDDGDISLRDAIAAAAPGETIDFDALLDGGTLGLAGGQLSITRTLTIDATTLPRGLTIDAAGNDPTPDENDGAGSRIFFVEDGNAFSQSPATLRGLTLVGGDVEFHGGAIHAREPLFVDDCTISNNAVYDGHGGGISAAGDVTIKRSAISGNWAGPAHNGKGGGIYSPGRVTIHDSWISGNTATQEGGGVYGRNVAVVSSTIAHNVATFKYGRGGGIAGDHVAVTSSTISDNRASSRGGGIGGGDVTITSSTISGNNTLRGGAIEANAVSATYSTISGNSAEQVGGGIYKVADLTLRNSIVAKNTAVGIAPDMLLGSGTLNVHYSLIGDNDGTTLLEAPAGSPDANGNLIGGPTHGPIDPMLAPLADNGGPTFTHAPLPGSPAIDAGDPMANAPMFDQRSSPYMRVLGGRMDIGAYEWKPPTAVDGDFNDDGLYDCVDIDQLFAAIASGGSNPAYDMTGDGLVNLADRDAWLAEAGSVNIGPGAYFRSGDANLDGFVDVSDFNVWNANKFSLLPVVFGWCQGNFNGDGVVDVSDFNIWNTNRLTGDVSTGLASEDADRADGLSRDLLAPTPVETSNIFLNNAPLLQPARLWRRLEDFRTHRSDDQEANRTKIADVALAEWLTGLGVAKRLHMP